ncbi:hypothetical protein [Chroococcus sp. FPU101]|uniref:hypothetical protein n=1 Tax=Chroococcus sp. FPU101 TaxID=1974212 RepID=UPI001A8FE15E|nr:hypothetical protein [Chroococcus sp. FPU101]GFE72324.1 hypothetical protein CFPU101_49340 [Chroococcus sp. FPU101]
MNNTHQIDNTDFSKYLCEYKHGNKKQGFEIFATSFEDAQERLKSIGSNGEVKGELFYTLNASEPIDKSDFEETILAKLRKKLEKLLK